MTEAEMARMDAAHAAARARYEPAVVAWCEANKALRPAVLVGARLAVVKPYRQQKGGDLAQTNDYSSALP